MYVCGVTGGDFGADLMNFDNSLKLCVCGVTGGDGGADLPRTYVVGSLSLFAL
jgi:hypothetical protein